MQPMPQSICAYWYAYVYFGPAHRLLPGMSSLRHTIIYYQPENDATINDNNGAWEHKKVQMMVYNVIWVGIFFKMFSFQPTNVFESFIYLGCNNKICSPLRRHPQWKDTMRAGD